MKIQEENSNILQIPFLHFQKNSEYQYRFNIKKELEERNRYSRNKLSASEEQSLLFATGYCRGFIDGVHQVMSELKSKKLEVQISTLNELKSTLLEDIEREIRIANNELERIKK